MGSITIINLLISRLIKEFPDINWWLILVNSRHQLDFLKDKLTLEPNQVYFNLIIREDNHQMNITSIKHLGKKLTPTNPEYISKRIRIDKYTFNILLQ